MAFEGDLSNLSLGDVLQTIAGARQVGTFIIRGEEERRLACSPQGVALISARSSLGLRIGTVLVGTRKITQEQLDHALKVQRRRRDVRLGEILVDDGACTEADVRTARSYIAAEEIYDLFMWRQGTFEFVQGTPDDSGLFADLWFDVPSLAMEAARRADELPRALAAAPPGEVFVRVDDVDAKRPEIERSRDLQELLALVDGARTVTDVHEAHYRGRFDTWKGMETLIERGFLRKATADEVRAAADAAYESRDFLRASRLYERAAQHVPLDESIRQRIADSLRDAGEKRLAAKHLVRLGMLRLKGGSAEAAVDTFRAAVALDDGDADAREGLQRALVAAGRSDDVVPATQAAAALRMSVKDFAGALRVADHGLAHRADDASLHVTRAGALQGLSRVNDAVASLDQAAKILTDAGVADERLIDVLRRIVQLDPERRDCGRRLEEFNATTAAGRRRKMQRVAVAAGVLLLACAAVPVLRGPSVESRIAEARGLVEGARNDAKKAEEARAVLDSIPAEELSADEAVDVEGLRRRLEQALHKSDGAEAARRLDAALDAEYRKCSAAILEGQLADGLAALLSGLEQLDGEDAAALRKADDAAFQNARAEATRETDLALATAAGTAEKMAARVTSTRDRFDATVWKREDLDVLHELIDQSAQIVEATKGDSWRRVPELVRAVVAKTRAPADGSDKKTVEAAAVVVDGAVQVTELHDRALLRARRKELKEGFVATYAEGAQWRRQGKFEDALKRYDGFLAQCDALKSAKPESLYAPVLTELFGGELMLDKRVRTERERIAAVLGEEAEAAKAESERDFETAFRVRKRLLEESPDVDFSHRFEMPLLVETAPHGAEVLLLDGTPSGKPLGKTPLATRYPAAGGAKFRLRLAGYADHDFVRKGAADDVGGVERVVLPKLAKWKSKPSGTTEAPPAQAPGSIVVAGRDGVVRRIDAATGAETARFAPGLLDGFSGAAVARGDLVFVAALDGKGWVLKLDDLTPAATFETGAARGGSLGTPLGVVVADETAGVVRLVGDDGRALWTTRVGRVRTDVAACGDTVVVVTSDADVVVLSSATGEEIRRRRLRADATWGAPTVRGGRMFVGSAAGDIACLDASTLADAWTRRLDGPVRGRICATDLLVVACTGKGAVHVLDAETGDALSTAIVGERPDDAACGACDLPDGGFVVTTKKGAATRFDANGRLVWKFDAGEDVAAPPRLLHGAVVLVTKKGVVVSLEP